MAQYVCPAGFDCAAASSCPAPVIDCPPGFFCGSLAAAAAAGGLHYPTLLKAYWVTAAPDGQPDFDPATPPPLVVSTPCPAGFYCPPGGAPLSLLACPPRHYCPELSIAPVPCQPLSVCPAGARYPLDFAAALLVLLVSAFIAALAVRQNAAQRRAQRASRSGAAVAPAGKVPPDAGAAGSVSLSGSAGVALHVAGAYVSADGGGAPAALADVTVAFPPGRLSAILGPAAAGKSTLLNALRSGGAELSHGGVVATLAGARLGGDALARRVGLVPQDDGSVDRSLTVRELLTFNAAARRPNLSQAEVATVVDAALADVGLLPVADTIIGGDGDNAAANISGGQLKRVSIATELVALARPGAALLLDEVTAGLDSAVALDLFEHVLAPLAACGVTVVVVLQQPRPEIFATLHHLVLLQAGRCVYEGPPSGAAAHFLSLGYVQPPACADADFALDVLNGVAERRGGDDDDDAAGLVEAGGELAAAWTAAQARVVEDVTPAAPAEQVASSEPGLASTAVAGSLPPPAASHPAPASPFLRLAALQASRALTVRLRGSRGLLIYALIHVIMAAALSVGFSIFIQSSWRNVLQPPPPASLAAYCPASLGAACTRNVADIAMAQLLFFVAMAIGTGSALGAIPLFGGQVPVLRREASAGLHPLAYMAGRLAVEVAFTLWYGALFTGTWMLFAHPGPWYGWFGVIVPTALAAGGLGACAVVVTGGRTLPAAVGSVLAVVAFAVFSGIEPTYASVKDVPVVNWLWAVSFSTWAAEGTYAVVLRGAAATGSNAAAADALAAADAFGYAVSAGQARSIGALVGIGLAWRLLAAVLMWLRTPAPAASTPWTPSKRGGAAPRARDATTAATADGGSAAPRRLPPPAPSTGGASLVALAATLALAHAAHAPATSSCAAAVASLAAATGVPACGPRLAAALTNATALAACTGSPLPGVDCTDPLTLAALPSATEQDPVPLQAAPQDCPLCDPSAPPGSVLAAPLGLCGRVLHDALSAAVGAPDSPAAASGVAAACGSPADAALLAYTLYQGGLACASGDAGGRATALLAAPGGGATPAPFIVGALDLRGMTQCGVCGVLPCTNSPGQAMYCPANVPATLCPPGWYCPTSDARLECPRGFYCPAGSLAPVPCRAVAAGSCPPGSTREVVWVPLLVALLLVGGLAGLGAWARTRSAPPALAHLYGTEAGSTRSSAPAVKSVSSSTAPTPPVPRVAGLAAAFEGVRLVTGPSVRLAGVSGIIRAGRLAAIIGGSGAGKTSLMNVLLGREAATAGAVTFTQPGVSAEPLPRAALRRLIGFVPQVDVLTREMTVEQVLVHSARLRLPRDGGAPAAAAAVEAVIAMLGLDRIRHVTIGGGDTGAGAGSIASGAREAVDRLWCWLRDRAACGCLRGSSPRRRGGGVRAGGLSSGDRKLVSLGVELVASPALLALDEPTSNLDATSAMALCRLVRALCADTGMTALAVLHQPRAEIFGMIDDLIVLVPGGRVAYAGPAAAAVAYFGGLGYPCPAKANRTDFLLDVVAGAVRGSTSASGAPDFASLWEAQGTAFLAGTPLQSAELRLDVESSGAGNGGDRVQPPPPAAAPLPPPACAPTPAPLGRPASFLTQAGLYARRAVLQRLKRSAGVTELLSHLLGGVVIGIVTCGGPLVVLPLPPQLNNACPPGAEALCQRWLRLMVEPSTFYVTMALGALAISVATRVFGREKLVLRREAHAGASPAAYYFGKVAADLPFFAAAGLCFMAPLIAIAPWRAPAGELFVLCWAIAAFGQALGAALSLLMADVDAATLLGVIAAILFNLFGGFVPNLGGRWAYTQWTARALVAAELYLGAGYDVALFNALAPELHRDPDFWGDIGVLAAIIGATHAAGYVLLRLDVWRHVNKPAGAAAAARGSAAPRAGAA